MVEFLFETVSIKKILMLQLFVLSFSILSVSQVTYTFSNAGAIGRNGPTQSQVTNAYSGTSLAGNVIINTQGIQEWVVPSTGTYLFEVSGASGGSNSLLSGHGAKVTGEYTLIAGTQLKILVGQMGSSNAITYSDGGGGASFVISGSTLLFVAGGGGGAAQASFAGKDASLTTSVLNNSPSLFGSSGAGYSTNGTHFTFHTYTTVAQAFINGGAGQEGGKAGGWPGGTYGEGGFGGGGSSCSCSTGGGGGGGGYQGGGGGLTTSGSNSGFGGSSYIFSSVTNSSAQVLPTLNNGKVVITKLFTAAITQTSAINCHGDSTGTLSVSINGNILPAGSGFDFSWAPIGGNAATASGLTAGTYTCTITPTNSSSITRSFTITEPAALTATMSQVNVSCNGSSNGSASVVVTGGYGPYIYNWNPGSDSTAISTGLTAGTYTCIISDAHSCSISKNVTIIQPALLSASSSHINIICSGDSNGSASVIATGGTASYSYTWSPGGASTATSNNLSVGTYNCLITDFNGCTLNKSVSIVQADLINPIAIPRDITVYLNASGNTTITASDINNGSTDNCGIASMSISKTYFTSADLGANNVTLTITDVSGNSSNAVAIVTVTDNLSPVANVTNLPVIIGECSVTVPVPSATDNYAGVINATTTDALTYSAQGTYTINWTYTDGNGNFAAQTQTVIVDDNTPPVPDMANLPNVIGACSATAIAPTATDNCAGIIVATTTDPLTYSTQGTYTINWIYTDGKGNSSFQTQTIIVDDLTAPTFTSFSDVISCNGTVSSIAPINLSDNCSSNITVSYVLSGATNATGNNDASNEKFNPGTTTVTYTFTDQNGNSSYFSFHVRYELIDVTVLANQNILTANGTGIYQWFDCINNIPIAGATSKSFAPVAAGDYSVMISKSGCSKTSQCYNVVFTGISMYESDASPELSVFPNPTSGIIYVNSSAENSDLQISIFDVSGKEVYTRSGLNERSNLVNVEKLNQGVYFMKVSCKKDQKIIKFVKL